MPFFPQTSDTNFNHSSVTDVGGSQTNTTGGIHIQIPNYSIISTSRNLPPPEIPRQGPTERASDVYARILLTKGIGYPLWIPEPSDEFPEYEREGVSIGDVGVITFDGRFDFLFNICLPPGHPNNRRAPPNFEPLPEVQPGDVITTHNIHSPGCVIASKSITRQIFNSDVQSQHNRYGFHFNCAFREGALLVLPDGATRADHRFRRMLFEYAQRHVGNWYEHANSTLGSDARNGSLYLVTGADKSTNWCIASYSDASGDTEITLRFITADAATVSPTGQYSWESSSSVEARTCPVLGEGSSTNQCVFVRGYKLALSESLYERHFARAVKVADIVTSNPNDILAQGGSIPEATTRTGWLSWLLSRDSRSSQEEPTEPITRETDVLVEAFPNVPEPYHPSTIIIRHLLETNPGAEIAITHDDDWCTVMKEADTSIPDGPELLRRILKQYHPVEDAGCVFLVPNKEIDTEGGSALEEIYPPKLLPLNLHSIVAAKHIGHQNSKPVPTVSPQSTATSIPDNGHNMGISTADADFARPEEVYSFGSQELLPLRHEINTNDRSTLRAPLRSSLLRPAGLSLAKVLAGRRRRVADIPSSLRSPPEALTFSWRKHRVDPTTAPPRPEPLIIQPLTLEALIEALTPPAVPSLGYARSLAVALSKHSPIPRHAALNPVLSSLCAAESPISLQSAGYDILSAYWENNEAVGLGTADRLAYFSLFLGPSILWAADLWEPRFKALRALTKFGTEVVGVETLFLNVIKSWIKGGFDGLLCGDMLVERAERAERERSVDILAAFLTSVMDNPEVVARIPEEELTGVLQFYGGLVEQSIDWPAEALDLSSPPTKLKSNTPSRSRSHRRHPSSISISSILEPTIIPQAQTPKYPTKHPADVAITLYLNHLSSQVKASSPPTSLNTILPLLFCALSSCASPLPPLSVMPHSPRKSSLSLEDRLTETLNSLFAGPYSANCMMILKHHLFPPALPDNMDLDPNQKKNIYTHVRTSFGAHRTLRNYIRRALFTRLARAYISREASVGYSHSGAPGHMDVERELMERAWPKDDSGGGGSSESGWDAGRLGRALSASVEAWVKFGCDLDGAKVRDGKESILEEVAEALKDVLRELDSREDNNVVLEEEEATAVGETLYNLSGYIHLLRNQDGTPSIVPISQPTAAPTPFLRILSSLLSRDHSTNLNPLLSTTLLYIADHLTDSDTARIPLAMTVQHDLSPTSPDWLNNWESLFRNPTLITGRRPKTRKAVMLALGAAHESVKDIKGYRSPLADLVCEFCERRRAGTGDGGGDEGGDWDGDDSDVMWRILGDEVVLRTVEGPEEGGDNTVTRYIDLLVAVASEGGGEKSDDADTASITTTDAHSTSPQPTVMPILSMRQTDFQDGRSTLPSVMSLFTETSAFPPQSENTSSHSVVGAVSALVAAFSQLAFTPFVLEESNMSLAVPVYSILVNLVGEAKSAKARLTVLQFLMRLRADRNHRLYFVGSVYDPDGHVTMLASLINRMWDGSLQRNERKLEEPFGDAMFELHRPAMSQERDGRGASRGRGGPSNLAPSRSRSRVAVKSAPTLKPRDPIWQIPQRLPFTVAEVDTPSEALISYDPTGPGSRMVVPISTYLSAIVAILEKEKDWEILSYVLCHLPVQLANKHLFCGPRSRELVAKILAALCTGILNEEFASHIDHWPVGLKARDARGLAYHTLSVLVGYRRCFDSQQRHLLVETFQAGLNGQLSTIKCCLHALSLSAFELQSSITKCLPRILEMLSQIMSNPDMAVHILGFLSIVGSLRPLHANFTESDFKMVFGVALQYLQHHNRISASPTVSWALSQHVRILSYYIVYVWFLAVRLPDRPRHVRYITRQLLLANEGNEEVDEPTEVCFDWLARYAYGSADPRPTNSLLSNIVMNPTVHGVSPEIPISEKTWILGHSIVTIRTLARPGWIEVLTRRPSGFTRFLCRVENAPMVGSGDVDPDTLSGPASLMMERDLPQVQPTDTTDSHTDSETPQKNVRDFINIGGNDGSPDPTPADPITGYVGSGEAPSQRRKAVAIDPAFFALQLSSYPDQRNSPNLRIIVEPSLLPKFFGSLDRTPVIDTHKVGIMYVAPGQTNELDILRNTHGSPAYIRFLEGIGRLINLRGQVDVYAGGLNPDEDGEYAYAWWDDIGQILYHTATMMPSSANDPQSNNKKRHIGNDYVRIVWNDSGMPYRFDTLNTQFQFVNIVIEPHSLGAIAAFSNNLHEHEYFKVTVQRAPGMTEFAPIGDFKLISAENLPLLVRQLSLLADWFASIFAQTQRDTERVEIKTNWHIRLDAIRRFRRQMPSPEVPDPIDGIMGQESFRDFTTVF